MKNSAVPYGWDYNPSAWSQRIPILLLSHNGIINESEPIMHKMELLKKIITAGAVIGICGCGKKKSWGKNSKCEYYILKGGKI